MRVIAFLRRILCRHPSEHVRYVGLVEQPDGWRIAVYCETCRRFELGRGTVSPTFGGSWVAAADEGAWS